MGVVAHLVAWDAVRNHVKGAAKLHREAPHSRPAYQFDVRTPAVRIVAAERQRAHDAIESAKAAIRRLVDELSQLMVPAQAGSLHLDAWRERDSAEQRDMVGRDQASVDDRGHDSKR